MNDLSKTQVQLLTDADDATLEQWENDGLREAKTGRYKYDARQFFEWYFVNVYKPKMVEESEDGMTSADHKKRYTLARAKKAELKYQHLDEKLVRDVEAESTLDFTSELFRGITDELCSVLPKELYKRNEEDILIMSDKRIRSILLDISKEVDDGETEEDGN
jgi:hypothetical protein